MKLVELSIYLSVARASARVHLDGVLRFFWYSLYGFLVIS